VNPARVGLRKFSAVVESNDEKSFETNCHSHQCALFQRAGLCRRNGRFGTSRGRVAESELADAELAEAELAQAEAERDAAEAELDAAEAEAEDEQ
jgi:hypothetical protein